MSQDVQLYSQFSDPLAACERLGTALAKSGLFGCDRAEQGQALMLICMSERKSPTEILRNYDLVEGRLRKKALAMLAEFRQRGGKHKWIADGTDGKEAALLLTFDGSEITSRFTIAEAQRQGLVKPRSAWDKTPGNMLRARCISNGVAMLCPEVVAGSEEEAESSPAPAAPLDLTPRNVTPAPTVTVTAPAPKPAEPTPAPVIDIPASVSRTEPVQDAPALAAAGLAPATPTPTPAPAKPAPGPVTPETAAALERVIGDHYDKAMAWFLKEKWLSEGESILRLTETKAQRVVKQSQSWLRAIGAEEAK